MWRGLFLSADRFCPMLPSVRLPLLSTSSSLTSNGIYEGWRQPALVGGCCGGGVFSISNKMSSPPVCSSGRRLFIHKVHPFTHERAHTYTRTHTDTRTCNWHVSREMLETAVPKKSYSGEITPGCQASFLKKKKKLFKRWAFVLLRHLTLLAHWNTTWRCYRQLIGIHIQQACCYIANCEIRRK